MTPQVKELHELRAENKALKAKLAETEMELIELKRKIRDLMKKYASGGGGGKRRGRFARKMRI